MWLRNSLALVLLASEFGLASAAKPRFEYRATPLSPLEISEGTAINNAGAIVGAYQFSGFGAHAFLSRGTKFTDLGALGNINDNSIANDVNDKFQVVGTSGGTRGFVYEKGV